MTFNRIAILVSVGIFGFVLGQPTLAEEKPPVFESDIRPVLAAKCGKCHGEQVHKGGLDLSSMQGVRKGGESGESAIAETVEDSMLWIMIDGDSMPPEGNTPLTEKERGLIRQWLASGAKSEKPQDAGAEPVTQHDVLPIVLLRCATCHGAHRQDGKLDLRTPEAMKRGGKHGPAVLSGNAAASPMIQRIESEACPPRELLLKFFVKRPSSSEVETL
jgi:cytochrome c553